MNIGSVVWYYDFTFQKWIKGTVTKVDIPITWDKLPCKGLEIDGSLTRPRINSQGLPEVYETD